MRQWCGLGRLEAVGDWCLLVCLPEKEVEEDEDEDEDEDEEQKGRVLGLCWRYVSLTTQSNSLLVARQRHNRGMGWDR
jgi:hypothetical protein